MNAVRIQHDVYAQVLVNHVYDPDVLPRMKANTGRYDRKIIEFNVDSIFLDEYATYIRLIDEMLEQRYNYVIQSRRTIETFPVSLMQHNFSFLNDKFSVLWRNIRCWTSPLSLNDNCIVK